MVWGHADAYAETLVPRSAVGAGTKGVVDIIAYNKLSEKALLLIWRARRVRGIDGRRPSSSTLGAIRQN